MAGAGGATLCQAMMTRGPGGTIALLLLLAATGAQALVKDMRTADLERALLLARWPTSDAERARFHERYIFPINGPTIEYFAVQKVELVTEFRRLELIAEEHARINDMFGRGGLKDVEDALKPFRGRMAVVIFLTFDISRYITGLPEVRLAFDGPTILLPADVKSAGIYSNEKNPILIGARLDADFDAGPVGQERRTLSIYRSGKEIARVPMDFAKLN
jgi:hypothetical protein